MKCEECGKEMSEAWVEDNKWVCEECKQKK